MNEFKNYLIYAAFGLLVTCWKIFKQVSEGIKLSIAKITSEVLLSLIISLAVVPKLVKYLKWDLDGGIFLATIISMFSKIIIEVIEKNGKKKLEDKIDKL